MIVQEVREKAQALIDELRKRGKYDEPREGTHLSDLLWCNYKTYFRKKGATPRTTDRRMLRYELGYAMQYHFFPQGEEQVYEKDGILCSPDVENQYVMGIDVPLGEVKTAMTSSKTWPAKFVDDPIGEKKDYIEQIAGYCVVKGILRAGLYVFYVVGDYSRPFTPDLGAFEIIFTEQELEDYWKEFVRRKEVLEKALETNTMPDPHYMAFKKECGWCEVKDLCEEARK